MEHLKEAKRAFRLSRDQSGPPALDPHDTQFGTQIAGMNATNMFPGSAADLLARNATRFSIQTPDNPQGASPSALEWAVATPDSGGSPPLLPSKVMGTTQVLLSRVLPYGSGAEVEAEENYDDEVKSVIATPRQHDQQEKNDASDEPPDETFPH